MKKSSSAEKAPDRLVGLGLYMADVVKLKISSGNVNPEKYRNFPSGLLPPDELGGVGKKIVDFKCMSAPHWR